VPNLYDLLSDPDTEVTSVSAAGSPPPPRPPKPGSTLTASVESTDADRAGMLLGAVAL
jgi:hypothetical protein